MRGRMNGVRTYIDPINIGQLMLGGTIGEVLQSMNPQIPGGRYRPGLLGLAGICHLGWQRFAEA